MTNKLLFALTAAGMLALPMAAQAQGTLRGAATGTVGGILGVDDRPRFRSYVRGRGVRSYSWGGPVQVGTVLPDDEVTYYDVPDDYRARPGYRYTVVNDRPVLVDRSRRIVEVID
jgi:hypothetical protein